MKVEKYISQHNHHFYCEAIIYPNGEIEDAVPSHVGKLILISEKSQEEIDTRMPMIASPVHWLVCYTKCVAVWDNLLILPMDYTKEQRDSIQKLVNYNILRNNIIGMTTNELEHCDTSKLVSENGDISLLSKLRKPEKVLFNKF